MGSIPTAPTNQLVYDHRFFLDLATSGRKMRSPFSAVSRYDTNSFWPRLLLVTPARVEKQHVGCFLTVVMSGREVFRGLYDYLHKIINILLILEIV